jgi:hypothetical protein
MVQGGREFIVRDDRRVVENVERVRDGVEGCADDAREVLEL